jgi:hypothetical protein
MNIRRDLIVSDPLKRTVWTREIANITTGVNDVVVVEPVLDSETLRTRGLGLSGREGLPAWMTSEQIPGDPLTSLGYVPAVEVLHCRPGQGKRVLASLQASGINERLQGKIFTVDRYLLNGYGVELQGEASSSGGLPTDFDGGLPTIFDTGLEYEYDLQYTVTHNSSIIAIPLLNAAINRIVSVSHQRGLVITPVVSLSLEQDQLVISRVLLTGDIIIITLNADGGDLDFDDALNAGSDALTDNGKYYKFPNSDSR